MAREITIYSHLEKHLFILLVRFRVYLLSESDNGFEMNIGFLVLKEIATLESVLEHDGDGSDRDEEDMNESHTLGASASVGSVMIEYKMQIKRETDQDVNFGDERIT